MIAESKMFEEEDEAVVAQVYAKVDLEKYLYFLKNSFSPRSTNNFSYFEQQIPKKDIEDSELWLQNSQTASQMTLLPTTKRLSWWQTPREFLKCKSKLKPIPRSFVREQIQSKKST